jgi:ribosomal protein S18 acetylase RimI-like enzyme
MNCLKEENVEGVWVGLDPKNENARRFYQRLGFEDINDAPALNMGLHFDNWRG